MDFHRAKTVTLLLIIISTIIGLTYAITIGYYGPKMKEEIRKKQDQSIGWTTVVAAAKDIAMGATIKQTDLIEIQVPADAIAPNAVLSSAKIVGKLALMNIYKGEQIVESKILMDFSKLDYDIKVDANGKPVESDEIKIVDALGREIDPDAKYITIDVPKYNFVNERVKVGSYVDILIDKGQGKYEVVLPKVVIIDKIPISSGTEAAAASAGTTVEVELERPTPVPLVPGENKNPTVTEKALTYDGNPAKTRSTDYRITIIANEKEQRRVFHASVYGKFMLREYISPTQPESKTSFASPEEARVQIPSYVVVPKKVEKKTTNTSGNAQTNNQETTNSANATNPANDNGIRMPFGSQ